VLSRGLDGSSTSSQEAPRGVEGRFLFRRIFRRRIDFPKNET
jgi:hypothetical protein